MFFRESQHFSPYLLAALSVVGIGVPVLVLWQGWAALPWPIILITGLAIGLPFVLIAVFRVETEVEADSLNVRLAPLPFRRIPLRNIRRAFVRTYRPLREYGGWGLRYGWNGMAYNARGNRGVQLELEGGKRVLVGSQQPEELLQALEEVAPWLRDGP